MRRVAPTYELSYVTPPAEPVKQRSETHSAYLNFEVGKSVLLHDFKNNAAELKSVNKIVNEVRNDKNLKFTEFNMLLSHHLVLLYRLPLLKVYCNAHIVFLLYHLLLFQNGDVDLWLFLSHLLLLSHHLVLPSRHVPAGERRGKRKQAA